eukprot:TRINITY_DN63632_c3_g1_i1.p1 TRINITY_DN63632_c3_g1~~TRINITY_DN63632_c3_g1_i1.p1  ORF type:complete len:160 (-),score=24.72 TRINITY_DN63632_c3_g1_i1:373-816(-)
MIIPKAHREAVYQYLFKEGVLVAKKDNQIKHPKLDVPNLHVVKLMQSMTARELVKEQFAWRHYYWYLTNEGIQYLRDYLHLPSSIVPATLKAKATRSMTSTSGMRGAADGGAGGGMGRGGSGRDDYRNKSSAAPAGFKPSFGRGGSA